MAEGGVAGGGGTGEDGEGGVGLLHLAGEQVIGGDDGRAEGRTGGHGPALDRVGGRGMTGRDGRTDRQHGLGRGADEEPPLPGQSDQDLLFAIADDHNGAALFAGAGLGEGHIEGRGGLALRQGDRGAIGLGPGPVERQHLSCRPDQRRRLGHGVQKIDRRVAKGLARLATGEGEQADQGHSPDGEDQHQTGRTGRIGAERRIGQGPDCQHESDRHHDQQRIEGTAPGGGHGGCGHGASARIRTGSMRHSVPYAPRARIRGVGPRKVRSK